MGIYDELSQLDKPAPPSKKERPTVKQKAAATPKATREAPPDSTRPRYHARKRPRQKSLCSVTYPTRPG